jgi:hypothetical protein
VQGGVRLGRSLSAPPRGRPVRISSSEEEKDGLLALGCAAPPTADLVHENRANSADLDAATCVARHAQDDAGVAQDSTPHRDAHDGTALLAHPAGPILPQAPCSGPQKAAPLKAALLRELSHAPSTSVSPNSFQIYSDDGEMDQEEEEDEEDEERQDGMEQMPEAYPLQPQQTPQAFFPQQMARAYPEHPEHAAHPQHPEEAQRLQPPRLQPPREAQEELEEQDSAFVPEIQEDTDDEEQDAWPACEGLAEMRSKGVPTLPHHPSPVSYHLLRYMANCSVFVGRAPQGPAWTLGTSAAAT